MTIKSWRREFQPTEADSKTALKSPAEHSLRRWEGFTKANLKKHGVVYTLPLSETGCSLCFAYQNDLLDDPENCLLCPLSIVRGNVPCSSARHEERVNPYSLFIKTGNPRPMLKWLRKAVKYEREQKKKGKR